MEQPFEESEFDSWETRYHEFYQKGSRLDEEFRTSLALVRAGKSWTQRVEAQLLKHTGQTRARWQVLFAIGFAEQPVTMSELCKRVRVQWPTMVRVVESMERDDLIRREGHPEDKRSKNIYLTSEGRKVMGAIQPVLDKERAHVLSLLSDEELLLAQSILWKIFRAANT